MNSSESFRALECHLQHLLVVGGQVVGVPPGEQDQLAVTVDGVVEHNLPLSGGNEVPDVDVLNLRPGLGSVVGVAALVVGRSSFVPVEAPVSVGIDSLKIIRY